MISPLPFRTQATGAVASRWKLRATGLELGIDVVVFRVHQVIGSISYTDAGIPDLGNAEDFWDAAIAKAGGRSGAVRGVVSVATAPVRVARTGDGRVAYRTVGSGPPLVLVMGYAGSMESWDPQLVDALAHRFRVFIFDYAGIGTTSPLRAPLSIDAMASQTSALITALHPAQVRRLVLRATYPGTGAVRPPQSAVDDLNAGESKAADLLFPPGHTATATVYSAAATVYSVATSMYLESNPAPKSVVRAQANAILVAWAGRDAAVRRDRDIAAPTLVADGAHDRLVPAVNARSLAAGIAGSRLIVYKDAGHAFLFQDLDEFVPLVESFLSG